MLFAGGRLQPDHEGRLLAAGSLFAALNFASLWLTGRLTALEGLLLGGTWAAATLLALAASRWLLPQRDALLFPLVTTLAGWGIALVARLVPAFSRRQLIWYVVALTALLIVQALPANLTVLRRLRFLWLSIGIGLLASTFLFGVNPSGSPFAPRLWLGFRSVFFQPSELLKLLLIIFLAGYLADKRSLLDAQASFQAALRRQVFFLAPMLIMWGICMLLLILQRDLGTASLFFLIFVGLLYAATGQAAYLIAGAVLLGLAGVTGYTLFDVVRLRVDAWWNPWLDPAGRSFQIVQSLIAVAEGGLFGRGIDQGTPTVIPVVHSDFVYAAVAEEWGFIGAAAVTALLALLVERAFRLAAANVQRPFHALLCAGIGLAVGIQSLMIIGGVLKVIPLTGVTLPFVSYGGSSLLVSFLMAGLLMRISAYTSFAPTGDSLESHP